MRKTEKPIFLLGSVVTVRKKKKKEEEPTSPTLTRDKK
jgi:hypothetical protein